MKDNKGREIMGVYAIGVDAGYCVYSIDDDGDSVWTTYTWCGKFAKRVKNKLYYSAEGRPYFKKYGNRVYLDEMFC